MISQGLLVLPEGAPSKDQPWTTKFEVKNPQAGTQVVETTYQFDGTKPNDSNLAVFKSKMNMSFEGAPVKITEQSSAGEIVFNIKEGRVESSVLKQNVTIDETGGGQTKIDQNINVNVTPATEKSDKKADDKGAAPAEKKSEKSEKPAN
jgi:hypothetical protein